MVYRPLLGVAEPTSRIQPGGCESKVTGQKARPPFFFFATPSVETKGDRNISTPRKHLIHINMGCGW